MSGFYTGLGRIIGIKTKSAEELGTESNLLEVSVSVPTGERKREGMEYPPSNIFNCVFWGKRGDSLIEYLVEGRYVFFKGQLSEPTYYIKDGEAKGQLRIVNIDEFKIVPNGQGSGESTNKEESPTAKEKKTSSSNKSNKSKEEEDLLGDFSDINFD